MCINVAFNNLSLSAMNLLLAFWHRFATLATRMEQYIQGQSRDLVDRAYTKFVSAALKIISSNYIIHIMGFNCNIQLPLSVYSSLI